VIKSLARIIPRPVRKRLRYMQYYIQDIISLFKGKHDPLIPPKRKIFTGAGDYKRDGEKFLKYFIELGGLKPGDKVLDAGCGIGRMAVPLTGYLNNEGCYEGFDIVSDGIEWCKKKITPKFPNFHFNWVNVNNQEYNPKGYQKASEFVFPFEDCVFDFVFLTSVFTHMLPSELENYFAEVRRVLKISGSCFITYFILNEVSLRNIKAGLSQRNFLYQRLGYSTINPQNPEAAVAYFEDYIRNLYRNQRLDIIEPIRFGSWSGRREYLDYQDIIIAEKK